MLINHDTRLSLEIVTDLLNAPLADLAQLRGFVARHDISGARTLDEADLAAVRAVRDRFAQVFAAPDTRAAAALVNDLVASAGTTPQLTDHDGYDWHVHYFAPGATLAEHLAADCGMAVAFLVADGEHQRLRRCTAPDCGRAFVDLSRNRSRRYCSSRTCGNRLHVAAYRARQRELTIE
ncbi:CGNR zinc finger domain-containing protein [Streptomyces sp. A7024]|uniref:CGNR zinc finger domain-containing protein n=1 Tax=Streptomyces coryli TaxID=1128680 RepID=A0A6G4U341_9ACTN|nr:CGNR zinc finger domain-containing protein [Streptomyces coryli]